jgi:mono/diheme cytochrome c family protein
MKALKVAGALFALILVVAGGAVAFLSVRRPAQRPPSDEKVQSTPARIARGRYLAEVVSNCMDCHSDHSDAYGFPVKAGTEGQGGFVFDTGVGVPGVVVARNLTPAMDTGKGRWTDGELMRAIREGVDRDGTALFPMMPYEWFRYMSDDDVRSIVLYLRGLKPIEHAVPARRLDFPVNLFIKSVPQPLAGPIATPDDTKDHLGYGLYLARISGCIECHTPKDDHHQRIPSLELAGGFKFKGPGYNVVSVNITPQPGTYMATATKEEFIGRFRSWNGVDAAVKAPKGRNTVMPWRAFAKMTDQDLSAIYDYLKTVKPINQTINPFPEG